MLHIFRSTKRNVLPWLRVKTANNVVITTYQKYPQGIFFWYLYVLQRKIYFTRVLANNGLQWCARRDGLIEGDGRTPMNDRDMGKQRKSVFFSTVYFHFLQFLPVSISVLKSIDFCRVWTGTRLLTHVTHGSNTSTDIVCMFWKFCLFWAIWGALRNDDYVLRGEREHGGVQSGDPGNQYCMTKHGSSYPQIVYCLRVSGVELSNGWAYI